MMSKNDAVKLLIENGYDAEIINKVVYAVYNCEEDPFEAVRNILRTGGYENSFGTWRKRHGDKEDKNQRCEDSEVL